VGLKKHHDFMWSFTKSFLFSLKRPVFAYLLTLSTSIILLCSGLIYYFEAGQNPRLETPFDGLYYSVTVMTGVGFGDIAPITTAGRILTIGMMLLGTAIFVCYTAVLSVSILEIEMSHFKDRNS